MQEFSYAHYLLSEWSKQFQLRSVPRSSAAYLAAPKKGSIVILIAGDSDHLKYYKSGVINNPDCFKSGKSNHAVMIVGQSIDTDFGFAHWIVHNSWGTSWGELG